MRRTLHLCVVLVVLLTALPATADHCVPGEQGCMPSAEDCATGEHDGVMLGRRKGAASACVTSEGQTLVYAGGNPSFPCGTIVVLGQTVVDGGTPEDCDGPTASNELRFQVVVPSDYDESSRRYATLYLLPGGGMHEHSFDPFVDLQAVADQGFVVVVPFNGLGFYNDWRNGEYQLETLFVDGLVPHIDATYRTVAERGHRAITGFSQGGYGAVFLTARHPELFAFVLSQSGPLDLLSATNAILIAGYQVLDTDWEDSVLVDHPIFGNRVTDEVWWRDRNPRDLVANLRGADLVIDVGNGLPGAYEADPLAIALAGPVEAQLRTQNDDFVAALDEAGIPYDYTVRDGGHLIEYAMDALLAWLPHVRDHLGVDDPAAWDYRTAEPSFSAWGWDFSADPSRAAEFLEMSAASAEGVTLTGSGTTTVTTAGVLVPGLVVRLAGALPSNAVADGSGRITFAVELGPANAAQQHTPQAMGQTRQTQAVRFEPRQG